jgi:hypothetical protein
MSVMNSHRCKPTPPRVASTCELMFTDVSEGGYSVISIADILQSALVGYVRPDEDGPCLQR